MDVMTKDLRVMDATAIAFCRDNKIPIVVFDMSQPGSLRDILEGEQGRHDHHDARVPGSPSVRRARHVRRRAERDPACVTLVR